MDLSKKDKKSILEIISEKLKPILPETNYCFYTYTEDDGSLMVKITKDEEYKNKLIEFDISTMPGCCGIAVSHSTKFYEKNFSSKVNMINLARELYKVKEHIMRTVFKAGLGICTTLKTNETDTMALQEAGWSPIDEFVNKYKTGNTVMMYKKNL